MGAFDEDDDVTRTSHVAKAAPESASYFSGQREEVRPEPARYIPPSTPLLQTTKYGVPMPPFAALAIGLVIGLLVGGLPGILHRHHLYIFDSACLSLGFFSAGLFGALASLRKRQLPYAFLFIALGLIFGQIFTPIPRQLFPIAFLKLLF